MSTRTAAILSLVLGLLIAAGAFAAPIPAKPLQSASKLTFTASTSLFDTEGTFRSWRVTGKVDPDDFESSRVRVIIAAASIDTDNGKRDSHLRSPDFFDVAKYPHLTFATTSIRKTGEGRYDVTGKFTIKKTTREVTIPVRVARKSVDGKPVLSVKGNLSVDRYDYGLDYESGFFAPSLKRTVKISFDLSFLL